MNEPRIRPGRSRRGARREKREGNRRQRRRETPVVEPERFKDVLSQTRHVMKAVPATKSVLRELGTAGLVELIEIMNILPHRNFQDCAHDMDLLRNITGETMTDTILDKPGACYGCPIMCQRHTTRARQIRRRPGI